MWWKLHNFHILPKASPIIVWFFFSSLNWNQRSEGSPCGGGGAGQGTTAGHPRRWPPAGFPWTAEQIRTCVQQRVGWGLLRVGGGENILVSLHTDSKRIRMQAWVAHCVLVNGLLRWVKCEVACVAHWWEVRSTTLLCGHTRVCRRGRFYCLHICIWWSRVGAGVPVSWAEKEVLSNAVCIQWPSDPFHMGRGAKDSSGAGPFPPQGSGSHTSCQFCPLPDIRFP